MFLFRIGLSLVILFPVFFIPAVYADRCPTPDIIKERKISREYAWLIDERRTLEDVLSVDKLYSVRIQNKGEFVACYYSSKEHLLQMDARPLKPDCKVIEYGGNWESVNNSEKVCLEEDVYRCQYAIYCDETNRHDDYVESNQ